ncbi:MAG: DNA repair protein RecN [Planctomycetota bacterium]|jgi:DNA repair protein RecN (Recombination protein N)
MLTDLEITDLALIDHAELGFGPGLNALTGETGAGKSLLVTSLELLLGERPRGGPAAWVREGAPRARVSGRFELSAAAAQRVRDYLAEHLPLVELEGGAGGALGDELILGRTLERSGRSRGHINGQPVTLKRLRELAALVFEIHGQNTHQRLLEADHQRELLDEFGAVQPLLERYVQARETALEEVARLEAFETEQRERTDRLDLLGFQVDELGRLEPVAGEFEQLQRERTTLRHADRLCSDLGQWLHCLGANEPSVIDSLRDLERGLEDWGPRIEALGEPREELHQARLHLEECQASLASFADTVVVDPDRLEWVEQRLSELERLAAKYQCLPDELPGLALQLGRELEQLEHDVAGLDERRERAQAAVDRLLDLAGALTRARSALTESLASAAGRVFGQLALPHARLEIELLPLRNSDAGLANQPAESDDPSLGLRVALGTCGPVGADRVRFLFAANPGEAPRPLGDVASGGEAARVMLALRSVLSAQPTGGEAGADEGRLLVFDEIDTGVGGRLGPVVGEHLRQLGQQHQVLVVTHLPAIAAASDRHLKVVKRVQRGRTSTSVDELSGEARVHEIADMIAGGAGLDTACAEARRLLDGVA